MKIRVNYDLLDKIRESKTGVSLKRNDMNNGLVIGVSMLLDIPIIIASSEHLQAIVSALSITTLITLVLRSCENAALKQINIMLSINQLKQLSAILRSHYINTDYELLQDAYQYESNYSFILDENKIPRLKQEKYIMVPIVDRDGKREVSLVQEHLVGSKAYELSYGSPSKAKVLKPAFNC